MILPDAGLDAGGGDRRRKVFPGRALLGCPLGDVRPKDSM